MVLFNILFFCLQVTGIIKYKYDLYNTLVSAPVIFFVLMRHYALKTRMFSSGFYHSVISLRMKVDLEGIFEGKRFYSLVSVVSYWESLCSSYMSTSTRACTEPSITLLMFSLARASASRSPRPHTDWSSRMAARELERETESQGNQRKKHGV